jgi:photosystem II stability/assembly factor-like uncharacterized protein
MKAYFCVFFILALQTSYPQWQTYYASNANTNFFEVSVVSPNLIWACGSSGKVFKTTNGGISWIDASGSLGPVSFYHISAIDQNNAWITGDLSGAKVFRTTNGGTNWTEQTYNQPYWINNIHFFNVNTGIFIRDPLNPPSNDTAGFFITRNGGLNW